MSAVRSITFLCDSVASQHTFANILGSLGFLTLWEAQPLSALKRPDVTSVGLVQGGTAASTSHQNGCAIELLSLNSADAYRFNKRVRELKLLSVNIGDLDLGAAQLAGASVGRLPDFTAGGSAGLLSGAVAHAAGLFQRISASTGIGILPQVVFAQSAPTDAVQAEQLDTPNSETQGGVHPPPSLFEVVVGLPHSKQTVMENSLRDCGFQRNRRALSVWGPPTVGQGPSIRVLPAARTKPFSALVLHGDAAATVQSMSETPSETQGAGQQTTPADSGAAASPVTACMYGVKGGLPSASQGQVTSPLLPGLDIRVQSAPSHAPFFNESQDVYGEDVDVSLNPGHGDVPPLACRSIVGMELTASWKRQLKFLQNL